LTSHPAVESSRDALARAAEKGIAAEPAPTVNQERIVTEGNFLSWEPLNTGARGSGREGQVMKLEFAEREGQVLKLEFAAWKSDLVPN
jgi:hypothetical protein